jgi:hypothetical protein
MSVLNSEIVSTTEHRHTGQLVLMMMIAVEDVFVTLSPFMERRSVIVRAG